MGQPADQAVQRDLHRQLAEQPVGLQRVTETAQGMDVTGGDDQLVLGVRVLVDPLRMLEQDVGVGLAPVAQRGRRGVRVGLQAHRTGRRDDLEQVGQPLAEPAAGRLTQQFGAAGQQVAQRFPADAGRFALVGAEPQSRRTARRSARSRAGRG